MTVTKQVSLHGKRAFVSKDDQLVGRNGFVAGGDDKPSIVFPSPDTVALFDDFLGDLVADEWAFVKGDTGTVTTGAIQAGTGGVFRLTNESTPLNSPGENLALTQGLVKNWKPDQGGPKNGRLRFSARIKFPSVSRTAKRQHVFVGLGDSGGAEMPAYDTGVGIISNAADLVGFLFAPGGDTGWSLIAAKSTAGDSGDQLVVSGVSPSANTYSTLEMELRSGLNDTGITAHFWVDGVKRGSIASPVNSATALTPWIGFFDQDTGGEYLDIDYVAISAPRDTGL